MDVCIKERSRKESNLECTLGSEKKEPDDIHCFQKWKKMGC